VTDILDLTGWNTIDRRIIDGEYEIEAEYTIQPDACTKCGVIGNLYRHHLPRQPHSWHACPSLGEGTAV
jgi:hypothetical protein